MYDGRIKYQISNPPEEIEVDGRLYRYVGEWRPQMVTPEDSMRKVTR